MAGANDVETSGAVHAVRSLDHAVDVLNANSGRRPVVLQVTVRHEVPAWTEGVIEAAKPFDAEIRARLDPDVSAITGDFEGSVADEALAGWEIGVLTTLFQFGVTSVSGASAVRANRVRAIVSQLAETESVTSPVPGGGAR